jgi:hypothetical protein
MSCILVESRVLEEHAVFSVVRAELCKGEEYRLQGI